MTGLDLDDIHIAVGGQRLIAVDATVPPGQTLTIMGPSGCGKSSLLAYIGGFLAPQFEASGAVRIDGETISDKPAHERRTGILFQDSLLFPHMSIGDNLVFAVPPDLRGEARRARVEQALCDAGLKGFYDRDPATLSGGQQARAALMRVLLSKPRALLLDEPFSKLDESLRDQIRELVFAEVARQKLPTLLVTHDRGDADAAGGPVIALSPPGGK